MLTKCCETFCNGLNVITDKLKSHHGKLIVKKGVERKSYMYKIKTKQYHYICCVSPIGSSVIVDHLVTILSSLAYLSH